MLLYNGEVELLFDEKKHVYTRDGVKVPGVSTTCKILDKSYPLIIWATRVMGEKILETMHTYDGGCYPDGNPGECTQVLPWTEFVQLVDNAKSAHKEIKEDAADIGKQAHKILENLVKEAIKSDGIVRTEAIPVPDTLFPEDVKITNCVNSALRWMHAHNVVWKFAEKVVYSRRYNYAGTTDGGALVSSCDEQDCCLLPFSNVLSIIDYKSGNGIYSEALYQTAAYMKAHLEEFPDQLISDRWILRLGKDEGDFGKHFAGPEHFARDFDAFKYCLRLSEIHKLAEKRIKKKTKKKERDWLDE